jgi:hypothetical protein
MLRKPSEWFGLLEKQIGSRSWIGHPKTPKTAWLSANSWILTLTMKRPHISATTSMKSYNIK